MSASKAAIAAFILVLVAALIAAVALRYEITPTAKGESAYLLDRWTGEVQLLDGEIRIAVKRTAR